MARSLCGVNRKVHWTVSLITSPLALITDNKAPSEEMDYCLALVVLIHPKGRCGFILTTTPLSGHSLLCLSSLSLSPSYVSHSLSLSFSLSIILLPRSLLFFPLSPFYRSFSPAISSPLSYLTLSPSLSRSLSFLSLSRISSSLSHSV